MTPRFPRHNRDMFFPFVFDANDIYQYQLPVMHFVMLDGDGNLHFLIKVHFLPPFVPDSVCSFSFDFFFCASLSLFFSFLLHPIALRVMLKLSRFTRAESSFMKQFFFLLPSRLDCDSTKLAFPHSSAWCGRRKSFRDRDAG